MESGVTFIGLGEAGRAFAVRGARGYDLKLDDPAARVGQLAAFRDAGVTACDTPAAALAGARIVLSLVTADQALIAARTAAPYLLADALWLDLNSVAPATKRAAAAALGARAMSMSR